METQANDDSGNELQTDQREFGPGRGQYGPGNGKFKRGGFGGPPWMMQKGMMRKNVIRTRALIIGSTVILAGLILATRGAGRHRYAQ